MVEMEEAEVNEKDLIVIHHHGSVQGNGLEGQHDFPNVVFRHQLARLFLAVLANVLMMAQFIRPITVML